MSPDKITERNILHWDNEIQNALRAQLLNMPLGKNSGSKLLWTPNSDTEAAQDFINAKKGSKSTERRYSREIFRFYLWMNHSEIKGVQSITPKDIEAYLLFCMSPPESWCGNTGGNTLISSPNWRPFKQRTFDLQGTISPIKPSVNSIQNTLSILKSYFSFLMNIGYVRGDPTRVLSGKFKQNIMTAEAAKASQQSHGGGKSTDYPCRPPKEPEGFSLIQWQCLMKTLEEMPQSNENQIQKYHRAKFVISLLYYSGLRSEEARSHSHSAIQYDSQRDCLKMVIYGKGSKKRIIPIHPILEAQLITFRSFHGFPPLPSSTGQQYGDQLPLFPSYKIIDQKSGKLNASMSERGAEEWIKSIFKKAGDRMAKHYPEERLKNITSFSQATIHTIRHTRARHMLFHEGVDIRIVQSFLGHAKILTTQIYTDPSFDELLTTIKQ
jgi:site-specific recombinase XerD